MSLKHETPCDWLKDEDGLSVCPYMMPGECVDCEYWCGADEPVDVPEEWEEDNDATSY